MVADASATAERPKCSRRDGGHDHVLGIVKDPMTPAAASRTLSRALLVALMLLLATAAWSVSPAEAANKTVEVANTPNGAFTPASVTVAPGDTVTWKWMADEPHTVSFEDQSRSGGCILGCMGFEHQVTFGEVGEYPYRDNFGESTGTVIVKKPAPKPQPTETSSPSPEPEPEPTASPSPSPKSPSPSPSPMPTPPPNTAPRAGTANAPAVQIETPSESESGSPTASPSVSVPEPTFEGFPDAGDPSAEPVVGDVDVQPPGDGGASRVVWAVIGGLAVLGTLGAFGRVVLFGDPWNPTR